jgi:hypothetical protein
MPIPLAEKAQRQLRRIGDYLSFEAPMAADASHRSGSLRTIR